MKKEFPLEYELLCKKGHYPYEWVDSDEKLKFEGLPERRDFYSKLSQQGLTEEEYQHARNVYEVTNCKTFLDYHLIYLKTDVVLLADVFENFRETCMSNYSLDPANYITTPSFAWDAMLLMTKVELQLISDYKIYRMIEEQKRGGLCFVGSSRYAKANNRYLKKDYNPKEPENYIMYWDMNNLYGSAMVMPLPTGGHAFVEGIGLKEILETPDDNPIGYTVRADLRFPKDKHEYFRHFPPAPENLSPKEEWLTDFQKELAKKLNIKTKDTHPKLIPHLYDREGYVIDYRNLKYLVELGVEVVVKEVLKYEQSCWLKKFIDFNTRERKGAKNDFERDFFKLMNNAPYGKKLWRIRGTE
jgi:hypothetical protein